VSIDPENEGSNPESEWETGPESTPERGLFSNVKKTLVWFFALLVFGVMLSSFAREVRLVVNQPIGAWLDDHNADCAVVVTGGPNRVREGMDLLARRQIQKLIISGVNPKVEFRDLFPQAPYYGGVREQDVILERRSRTTYGNAQQTLPLVEALRCRDLVLVTSRVHMYRTLRTFRAEFPPGFNIQPRAVPGGSPDPGWFEVGLEALKSVFYSLWAY
jgi:uncharacterized SAM-binding protein YcdF (DUF218 family)